MTSGLSRYTGSFVASVTTKGPELWIVRLQKASVRGVSR
jgi:hypothetical protein